MQIETPTKTLAASNPAYSNPRVRQFFKFNPIDFFDDTIDAISYYINSALDSFRSLLDSVKASDSNKFNFVSDLIAKLQNSVDENADIFELYAMRNIFDISVNVDLMPDIDTPKKKKSDDPNEFNEMAADDFNDDELDAQLADLYRQIQTEQARRVELLTSLKTNTIKLNEARQLVQRLPNINKIIDMIKQLPVEETEQRSQKFREFKDIVKNMAQEVDSQKTLEYEKQAFTFD